MLMSISKRGDMFFRDLGSYLNKLYGQVSIEKIKT